MTGSPSHLAILTDTYSDDRRLSHYALLKGRVVSVDDAVAETEMPSTPFGVFRQRVAPRTVASAQLRLPDLVTRSTSRTSSSQLTAIPWSLRVGYLSCFEPSATPVLWPLLGCRH
jgi:hypothetical protein